jgi:hypothetical protein
MPVRAFAMNFSFPRRMQILAASSMLVFLAWTSPVAAQAPQASTQSPGVQSRQDAERHGRERNAEALQAILESRNPELLEAYERGVRNTSVGADPPRKMPPAIEALLVRYYDDPVIGGPLRVLATTDRHQTQVLFDLLLAEWRSGKIRSSTYPMRDSALRTDAPGVEPRLLEWIASDRPPPTEDLKAIISFLGTRQYAPAVPVLRRLGPEASQVEIAVSCTAALLKIATPESIIAALDRLGQMRAMDTPRAREAREYFLVNFVNLPPTVPLPYERFLAAEPDAARRYAPVWLGKRKDLAALPDTLALLADTRFLGALDAIVASDSPAAWQRARAEIESLQKEGRVSDAQYRQIRTVLDDKIADPEKHFAQVRREKRDREYEQRRAPIARAKNEAYRLKESDPSAYFAAMLKQARSLEALAIEYDDKPRVPGGGVPGDLEREFTELGDFARFRLRRPREALELYAAAERWGGQLGAFARADTLQFDLKDRAGALAIWKGFLARFNVPHATDPQTEEFEKWVRRWLEAQVAWLANGRRFSGAIDEVDMVGPQLAMMFWGAGGGEEPDELRAVRRLMLPVVRRTDPPGTVDPKELARLVAALPPSGFILMRSAGWLPWMPDAASILAFLERNDPAGYVSAAIFAAVARDEEDVGRFLRGATGRDEIPAQFREAATRFLRDRRIISRLRSGG